MKKLSKMIFADILNTVDKDTPAFDIKMDLRQLAY
jgi:hypothetical protein